MSLKTISFVNVCYSKVNQQRLVSKLLFYCNWYFCFVIAAAVVVVVVGVVVVFWLSVLADIPVGR